MKKLLLIVLAICMLTSCSMVFKASASGQILDTESDTGIANTSVFIYTDKAARDADFSKGNTNNAICQSQTNANGEFAIDKIIWESFNSDFGKTADKINLYYIFENELYSTGKYFKSTNPSQVFSDSSNASSYKESFSKTKEESSITFRLVNVATDEAVAIAFETSVTAKTDVSKLVKVNEGQYNAIHANDAKISGSYSINSDDYYICDKNGVIASPGTFTDYKVDTKTYDLYVKPAKIEYPIIEGTLSGTITDNASYKITAKVGDTILGETTVVWENVGNSTDKFKASYTIDPSKTFDVAPTDTAKIANYPNEKITFEINDGEFTPTTKVDLNAKSTEKKSFSANLSV